jgi:hypothetical protein
MDTRPPQRQAAGPPRVRRSRLVACLLALGLGACASDPGPLLVDNDEALYASLYPYYAELCALSEISKKPGFGAEIIAGGPGGHSVLYLNGVCRDPDAHYPTVKLCDAAAPAPGQGVGLSVNAHYKNASWVATEGRDFFFQGNLRPHERLTRSAYQRTQAQAQAMGILDGVEFHAGVFDDMPRDMSRRDFMYDVSIGTDYAIGFARDRYCARVPMDRDKMRRIVDFLNRLNDPYKNGRRVFEWNVLTNNCSHVLHNALGAAGVWEAWAVDQFILFAAFDFPVPKNEFVNLMRRTNDLPLGDLDALYRDDVFRRDLLQDRGPPAVDGALAEAKPAVPDNDVYATDLALIFYDEPITGRYRRHFREIFSESRYFDLRANLRHFAALYAGIQAARRPLERYLDAHRDMTPEDQQRFARFYDRYYRFIERESAAVEARLARLDAPTGR